MEDQACSSACNTGTRNTNSARQIGRDTETIISDSSASSVGEGRRSPTVELGTSVENAQASFLRRKPT